MTLIVDRFIKVLPREVCERPVSTASLTDTCWLIDTMMGETVEAQENRREPHIVLQTGPERRFRATVGCTRMLGRYTLDDPTLTFNGSASTMMACPPPLDTLERRLSDVLSATSGFRREGQTLVLRDADGSALAELAAVFLR